jgi:glycosyltransferase involved in cell wall biosynthesis
LERLANELGVAPAIRWLGWQAELGPFYRAIDVLLFNSEWDAFGLTPVEAMSHAVPVVCSVRHGGLREAIAEPRWGVLLDDHDESALADAAIALLRDPGTARRTGLAGRDRVADLCSVDRCVAAVEALLAGGLSRLRSPE